MELTSVHTILGSYSSEVMLYTLYLCCHRKGTALLPVQIKKKHYKWKENKDDTWKHLQHVGYLFTLQDRSSTSDNKFESTGGTKHSYNGSGLFAIIDKKWRLARGNGGIWADSWSFLAGPASVIYFSAGPEWVFFTQSGHQWFLLEFITSTHFYLVIFTWTFMLHCLRGRTRAIPAQIHCQYMGGARAAGP